MFHQYNFSATTKQLSLIVILTLLISACATTPPGRQETVSVNALLQKAYKAESRGDYEAAARDYLQLADGASALKRQEYKLQAASTLLRGNFIDQADRVIQLIDERTLHNNQRLRKRLLIARIKIAKHDYPQALKALDIHLDTKLPNELRAEAYRLRAQAYESSRQPVAAARQHMLHANMVSDPNKRLAAQQAGWQLLLRLPDNVLATTPGARPPDEFGGWLSLARLIRQAQHQQVDLTQALSNWRQQYPLHPIVDEIMASLLARQDKMAHHPQTIALLLPFNGPYDKPARSLRDGFLAARYQQTQPSQKPTVRIYDLSTFNSIKTAYQQAIKEGAEFVVGPLNKEDVNELSRLSSLPIPVLTLNYGETSTRSHINFFQFGLSPEDEARQAAERAWLDGYNQALIITPEGDWGERMAAAFAENWQLLGGTVLEQQNYPAGKNDFSLQIRQLLNIDESLQRHTALQRLTKQEVKFEPRRRQDPDFIFMAAFPRQARLLRPQLKFHFAGNLPIYSTSHIFTGKSSRHKDRDMDDIIFCDIPWVLSPNPAELKLKRQLTRLWPDLADQYTRFYALGIDAYNIIPHLDYMRDFSHERFNGNTGLLQLSPYNRIFRQLSWARFQRGHAKAL